jgi:hypothetical protein
MATSSEAASATKVRTLATRRETKPAGRTASAEPAAAAANSPAEDVSERSSEQSCAGGVAERDGRCNHDQACD